MEKKSIADRIGYGVYRFTRFLIWLFYHRPEVRGAENLPEEPCIVVGNHTKTNGPICAVIYYPRPQKVWCIGQMMHMKEVPDYAFNDFWSKKPKCTHWFFHLVSHVLAYPAAAALSHAPTIAVYRDTRVMNTYRDSMAALDEGNDVIIFPECPEPCNHIVNSFQSGFVDVARMYARRSGKPVSFVPLYNAPALHLMVLGEPVEFNPKTPIREERDRICRELTARITAMAEALPEHLVVPYDNIPKKNYHTNLAPTELSSKVSDP